MIAIAVYRLLGSVSAVSEAVSDRIWPGMAAAPSEPPFIVYSFAGGTRWQTLTGPSGLTQARVQIDVYAAGYAQAQVLAGAIHTALNGFRGEAPISDDSPPDTLRIGGISAPVPARDSQEPDAVPPLWRVSQDFLITYNEE